MRSFNQTSSSRLYKRSDSLQLNHTGGKMATNPTKTDVFPTRIDTAVQLLPKPPNFHAIASNCQILPFIIYLLEETIYYKKVEWNPRYQKHFYDTGSYIRTLSRYEEKPWSWAARKLKKDVGDNLRKNVDTRTCYKYMYNFFLVKSCFTTGQRIVEAGTKHIYQIGAVQMIFYFADKAARRRIQTKNRLFKVEEQFWYRRRTLKPHQSYVIPENTIYVLYATNKSYFSIHILESDTQLPFTCLNPIQETIKRASPSDFLYRRPVRTPLIEDVVIGDEEEEEEEPSSDPVLMTLESGHEMTASLLMPPPPLPPSPPPPPPPPPPQPTFHQLITIATIPIDKTIQVVAPDTLRWYQSHFQFKEYRNPKEEIMDWGLSDQSEPLNLSMDIPVNDQTFILSPPTAAVPTTACIPENDQLFNLSMPTAADFTSASIAENDQPLNPSPPTAADSYEEKDQPLNPSPPPAVDCIPENDQPLTPSPSPAAGSPAASKTQDTPMFYFHDISYTENDAAVFELFNSLQNSFDL